MSFLSRAKNFIKKYWTFITVIGVPVIRFMWKLLTGTKSSSSAKKNMFESLGSEGYKKGDVIDVEVKK